MSKLVSSRAIEATLAPKEGTAAGRRLSRALIDGTADRRRVLGWLAVGGLGSAVLAACGGETASLADEDVTRTNEVEGAPAQPTQAPAAAEAPAGGDVPAAEDVAQAPPAGEVTIAAYDIGWEYDRTRTAVGAPIDVTVAPGATISLENTGAAAHNFVVETLDNVVVDMPVGQTVTYTVPADASGTHEFICNLPGHEQAGMVGNLIVDPNAAAPAAAQGGEEAPAAEPAAAPADQVAAPAGGAVTISAYDIGWEYNGTRTAVGAPIEVPVAPGQAISLPNTGAAAHNFVVETLDNVVVDMPVGQTVEYTVPADAAPGSHEFICNLPGHEQAGMVGNLVIG